MSPGARAGKRRRSASGRDNADFSPEGSGSGSSGGPGSLGPPCGGDSDPGDAREKRGEGLSGKQLLARQLSAYSITTSKGLCVTREPSIGRADGLAL